jgi:TatD DNase family protein
MKFFDTHCHVQMNSFETDADEVIKKTLENGVLMNLVGTQYQTSEEAVEMAKKYEGTFVSVGLHPAHLFPEYFGEGEIIDKTNETEFDYEKYKKLAQNKKVVAIGECGLDVYRLPKTADREKVLKKQTKVFVQHVTLGRELNLPLVIHVRSAHKEMIEILKKEQSRGVVRGVIHCYDSTWEHASQLLDLGFNLGFTGILTFPPKKNEPTSQLELLEVVRKCPLDRILLETDAPFLAPIPYRGKRAEPWMVEEVAKKIAEIKSASLEEVARQTTQNAYNLFKTKTLD